MHAPRWYVERFPNLDPERSLYAAVLAAVDDAAGQVTGLLKQFGLLDNTLVFFGADEPALAAELAALTARWLEDQRRA